MHLKWPSGHSRLKHGLQAMSIRAIVAFGDIGGVYAGDDEPKSATSGAPTAAAACIRPESLLTTTEATDRRSIAVPRSVRPARSTIARPASPAAVTIASPIGLVVGRADQPDVETRRRGIFARARRNCSAGQRFAGPNSAPGHSIATRRSSVERERRERGVAVGDIGNEDRRRRGRRRLAARRRRAPHSGRRAAGARLSSSRRASLTSPQRTSPR